MSTLLGVNCLRSSTAFAVTLRPSGRQMRSATHSTNLCIPLLSPARCLSARHVPSLNNDITSNHSSTYLDRSRRWAPSAQGLRAQRRSLFGRKSQPAYSHYLDVPPDYKDEEGLPFQRDPEISTPKTTHIFRGCAAMTPSRANRLLKILHGRRVAGTLDDPSLRVNTSMFTDQEIAAALKYLRDEVPVDEVLNAGLRAEDELRELEAEQARAQEDEHTSDAAAAPESEHDAETASGKKHDARKDVYGEGVLDRIRATNIARREAEERAEAERLRREEEAAAQNWGGLAAYDPALHRGLHPKQLEHYEAATSDLEAPPEIPRWRVLLPTTAFAAVILAALYLVVDKIAPPRPGRELIPARATDGADGPTGGGLTEAQVVVGTIMLVNTAVFIAWRRVRLWKHLNRHFVLDFVSPRPYQILTAMITHQDARHLLRTMFLAAAGGSLLISEVGPVPFLATYAASGVCGYLATLWTHVLRGNALLYMFGASSAGFGVVCAYFWLYRFDGFKILGLPPDPYEGMQGLGIIGLLVAFYALVPMVRAQGGGVDWMSHLAGMLVGMGCASAMEGRWRVAKAEKMLQEAQGGSQEKMAG